MTLLREVMREMNIEGLIGVYLVGKKGEEACPAQEPERDMESGAANREAWRTITWP